jgi:4-hydroxy-tetrahydrodipicolinate synthase
MTGPQLPTLAGVFAVTVTPFDEHGNIDFHAYEQLIEHLLACGVHGLAVCGTTSEYYALTSAECGEIMAFVARQAAGRAQLIAGTNATTTREVIALSRQAQALGYDAVLLPPPPVSRPSTAELAAHYRAVDDAAGIPIVLYNNPFRCGVEIGFDLLDLLRDVPRCYAIKESSGSLDRLHELAFRFGDRYALGCGSDSQAVEFFLWGARFWLAGPANVLARELVEVYHLCVEQHDFVAGARTMKRLLPLLQLIEQSGKFIQCCKYGSELEGTPVGGPRSPLLPLTAVEKERFRALYKQAKGGG